MKRLSIRHTAYSIQGKCRNFLIFCILSTVYCLLSTSPLHSSVLLKNAREHYTQGEYQEAIAIALQALEEEPSSRGQAQALIAASVRKGRQIEREDIYDKRTELFARVDRFWFSLIDANRRGSMPEEDVRKKAEERKARQMKAEASRPNIIKKSGAKPVIIPKPKRKKQAPKKKVQAARNPQLANKFYFQGLRAYALRNFEEATFLMEKAVSHDPTMLRAQRALKIMRLQLGL
ncbi:hypothetical protein ACFL6Y_09365 [Elusimicrobiota bacterium]